jgi:hypothetical protein
LVRSENEAAGNGGETATMRFGSPSWNSWYAYPYAYYPYAYYYYDPWYGYYWW